MSDTTRNESAGPEQQELRKDDVISNELSPGAQLSARREALNWSIEQVAAQLNLAPRQIQAIEADNFAALPGMAVARGFIRSYAKLLNVDAAPLLQIVAKDPEPLEVSTPMRRPIPAVRLPENRLSSSSGGRRLLSRNTGIVLLLVLLAGGAYIIQQTDVVSRASAFLDGVVNTGGSTVVVPLDQADVPMQDAAATAGGANDEATDEATDMANATPVPADVGTPLKSGMSANDTTLDTALGTLPAPAGKVAVPMTDNPGIAVKDVLTLKFREESWIEIKRPDDSTVVSALFAAGATETVKITGPVAMTVGNAAGVDATLRGKRLELKSGAKSNVARLNLK